MVNINDVYQALFIYQNKNQGGGYAPQDDFNRIANLVNLSLLDDDFKVYQQVQQLTDRSKPFITNVKLFIPPNGQLPYPSDYYYFLALGTYEYDAFQAMAQNCKQKGLPPNYSKVPQIPVELIDTDKQRVRNLALQYQASYEFPQAIIYNDYIQFYPIDLGGASLDYLRQPDPVLWAYTIDPTTQLPVYDPVNSINFEWTDNSKNEIIGRIAEAFGIEVREYDFAKAMGGLNT